MKCLVCDGSLEHKRKDAKFCSTKCKWDFHRDASAALQYRNSVRGRAVSLYHGSKIRKPENNELTVEWIEEQLLKGCAVTGLPFIFEKGKNAFAPSLDRIDNSQGYTKKNVRAVVWMYNSAKNSFTDDDVFIMANALVQKNKEKC